MDSQVLAHLERVERVVDDMTSLPWISPGERDRIRQDLFDFDADYWHLVRMLSLPLYQELSALLTSGEVRTLLPERPRIAVVIPLHQGRRELLRQTLHSLRCQVGVAIECWISVDGLGQDRLLAESMLLELGMRQETERFKVELLFSEFNRGVGMCRNLALENLSAPFFTCLDADDVFHPLRCLHALLVMLQENLMRLNTGWCRASLIERKLVLINDRLAHVGHNSFIARTELLKDYGYQADLRFFEDTEFMLRHHFYGVAMKNSTVVSHYLHTEPHSSYVSLASPCRMEVHAITEHPYLCGTVIAEQPESWKAIELEYQQRYQALSREELSAAFPSN